MYILWNIVIVSDTEPINPDNYLTFLASADGLCALRLGCSSASLKTKFIIIVIIVVVRIIIMEKTEAGLKGLCIREIDVKSQILVHKILQ